MTEFLTITCPHCGEDFQTACDSDEGSADFIVDCEVCCRPMSVRVHVRRGTIESVEVSAA